MKKGLSEKLNPLNWPTWTQNFLCGFWTAIAILAFLFLSKSEYLTKGEVGNLIALILYIPIVSIPYVIFHLHEIGGKELIGEYTTALLVGTIIGLLFSVPFILGPIIIIVIVYS